MLRHLSRLMKGAGILLIIIACVLLGMSLYRQYNASASSGATDTNGNTSPSYLYTLTIPDQSLILPVEDNSKEASISSPVVLSKSDSLIIIKGTDALYEELSKIKKGARIILTDQKGVVSLYQYTGSRTVAETDMISSKNGESLILAFSTDGDQATLMAFDLILMNSDEADT